MACIRRLSILAGLSLMSACSLIPSRDIYTEIDIEATPDKVWKLLADNPLYPQWNPYHVRVEGDLSEGERLFVEIHKPDGKRIETHPHVIRVRPGMELIWGGGIPGVFVGEHVFLLEPLGKQSTRLIKKERFSGVAIPFTDLDGIGEGYRQMNEALKRRVESGVLDEWNVPVP
jgi:hypothetical protein